MRSNTIFCVYGIFIFLYLPIIALNGLFILLIISYLLMVLFSIFLLLTLRLWYLR
jgi:hypothetical protein